MEHVFLHIFNMSLIASILAAAVLVLRLLLKRASRAFVCILWGFVAIRLIFPISPESPFSLIPTRLTASDSISAGTFRHEINANAPTGLQDTLQAAKEPAEVLSAANLIPQATAVEAVSPDSVTPLPKELLPMDMTQADPPIAQVTSPVPGRTLLHSISRIASVVWLLGVLGMLSYAGISYLRIRKRVKEAVLLYDNLWLCDHVETPFIFGIFRPRILLPSSIQPVALQHVVAHEKAHLKRLDHLFKPLGFVLLSVYWFNPILWAAYLCLCKDIELACDERVICRMDAETIKAYTSTLLNYSVSRKMISICPLAFGEVHVKKRIKNALHYKKPAFWVTAVAIISCIAVAVCFLTNPKQSEDTEKEKENESVLFTSFQLLDTGSDITGIQIKPEPYAVFMPEEFGDMSFRVQWSNNNYNREFVYRDSFDILYSENDAWHSCATNERSVPEISSSLAAKSEQTKTYSLKNFDFSKNGTYRFQAEPHPGEYVWFEFETTQVKDTDGTDLTEPTILAILRAVMNNKDMSAPHNAANYPDATSSLVDLLISGGSTTVDCFVDQLKHTKKYGIREHTMAQICAEITGIGLEEGEYDPETWWANAEQWLAIYKKEMAKRKAKSAAKPPGTTVSTAAPKKDAVTLLSHPVTPVTRSLVWVNYFYNRTKNPEGVLKMELPEFPGVTFYADSREISAHTDKGAQTLISGEALLTAYLADLNSDSYPEFCATVNLSQRSIRSEIVVYDYKNQKLYRLPDTEQSNYALFGDTDSMYVQSMSPATSESPSIARLALTEAQGGSLLTLEPSRTGPAASEYAAVSGGYLDLIGYSRLYADLALPENRWSSSDMHPICHIYTPEDWEAFVSHYPDILIWTKDGPCTLTEVFGDSVATLLETYEEESRVDLYLAANNLFPHAALYLTSNNLLLGFSYSPVQGYSGTVSGEMQSNVPDSGAAPEV